MVSSFGHMGLGARRAQAAAGSDRHDTGYAHNADVLRFQQAEAVQRRAVDSANTLGGESIACGRTPPYQRPYSIITLIDTAFGNFADGTTEHAALYAVGLAATTALHGAINEIDGLQHELRHIGLQFDQTRHDHQSDAQHYERRLITAETVAADYRTRTITVERTLLDLFEASGRIGIDNAEDFEALFRTKLVELNMLPEPDEPEVVTAEKGDDTEDTPLRPIA